MKLIKQLERIEYVDYLIRNKVAVSAPELSSYLKISERQVMNIIQEMKLMGAPLIYERKLHRYIFTNEKIFIYGFKSQ
jgi:predicted DNA-binding transcriptional regulator YafY